MTDQPENIIFGEKCKGCGNPKYDCKCPDQPEQSAEENLIELLERRFVTADGTIIWNDQVKGLIQSFAKQEVKKACKKQREICTQEFLKSDRSSDIPTLKDYSDAILNAPLPKT